MAHARYTLLLVGLLCLSQVVFAEESIAPTPGPASSAGRYQLVVVPGQAGNPFLIDTSNGCVWHIFLDEKTRRSTFVEVDVENLHWSWGSGAQQILASRVDASNLSDEQKRGLKQDLQRTACGLSHLVLTPGAPQRTGQTPPESEGASSSKKKEEKKR